MCTNQQMISENGKKNTDNRETQMGKFGGQSSPRQCYLSRELRRRGSCREMQAGGLGMGGVMSAWRCHCSPSCHGQTNE